MGLNFDGSLTIATGNSRKDKKWVNKDITWSDFLNIVGTPHRTAETVEEYQMMTKDKQDAKKDVGGYVGGKLKDSQRKNGYVEFRGLLTLDEDYAQDLETKPSGYARCIYTTRNHKPEAPRRRHVIPLKRSVTPDEYQAIARKVAEEIGIELFDD
ncbi:MAG: hypothetical protein M0T74_14120, partial [Desulfitobacterium hafniense]|nr:hypothetical protein [Desulfitobacterium hafniense]